VGADPILTVRDTETSGASTNATLRLAESGASDTLNNYWDINHTGGSNLRFVSKIGTITAERFRIDASGNVGIGTSSPSAPVHVYKSQASPTIVARFENPADEAIVEIKSKNTDLGVLQFADTEDANVGAVQYSHSDNSMRFKTNDSERMRIDATGNVGIGTSSPNSLVDIKGIHSQLRLTDSDDNKFLLFSYSGGKLIARNNSTSTAVNQFTLTEDGKFGIGTVSPTAKLAVSGTSNGAAIDWTNTTASTGRRYRLVSVTLGGFALEDRTAGTERMRIDASGHAIIPAGVTLGTAAGVYSADNTLDDYEEGTWTPTIIGSTSGTASLNVATSSYTKIGNTVRVDCYISSVDVTGLNGAIRLSGLPFGAVGYCPVTITYCNLFSFDESTTSVGGFVESGHTYVNLVKGSSKTTITSTDTNATSGTLMFHATYKTSA